MIRILLSGKRESGKSTFCKALQNALGDRGFSARIIDYTARLNAVLARASGLSIETFETQEGKASIINFRGQQVNVRELQKAFGSNRRQRNLYHWINARERLVKQAQAQGFKAVLCSNGRYPNEVENEIERGALVIRLLRTIHPEDISASETALDTFDFDRHDCIRISAKTPLEEIPELTELLADIAIGRQRRRKKALARDNK